MILLRQTTQFGHPDVVCARFRVDRRSGRCCSPSSQRHATSLKDAAGRNTSPMTRRLVSAAAVGLVTIAIAGSIASAARSAPTAEVAKRCLTYAYRLYPFQRAGAA